MVNNSSNNNQQNVNIDCNNKYMCGTPIKKRLGGINYYGSIKSYNEQKKIYVVQYYQRNEIEEVTNEEIIKIINTDPPRRKE